MDKKLNFWYAGVIACVVFLLLAGCKNKKDTVNSKNPKSFLPNHDTVMTFGKAAYILSSAKSIDGPSVGIAGIKSEYYRSYEWLVDNAYDSALYTLVRSSNPYTRTYAFMALCKRKQPRAKKIFEENINDSTSLTLYSGCLGFPCDLNKIWFREITKMLNTAELKTAQKKINKNPDRSSMFFW